LAFHYQSNPDVMFGLMNEPHDQSASAWLGSANAAIAAIRGAGAVSQEILVPGSYWDGAWTWTSTDNDTVIGAGVQDPAHNFAFEVHQYLDADGSGTHAGAVSATIGVERLTAITQWAEATGNHLFLGEVGVTTDQTSLTAFDGMLTYMQQHTGAWQGVTYWAGGPWWGNYMFSIEPQNGIDKPQMGILVQHLASPGVYNGTPGADYIAATGNLLQAFGNDGNDQLYFNGNQNQLSGGNGDDTLQANGANNHLFGNAGNDRLGVSGDSNQLSGGAVPVPTRSCSMGPRSRLHSQGPRSSIASSITTRAAGRSIRLKATRSISRPCSRRHTTTATANPLAVSSACWKVRAARPQSCRSIRMAWPTA
ncbi:MAG TPA: cellulase family glycosylhydrolase, partial [Bradyrhizobium sp.]|nr:cellulase family glycosylhydrolase [Bradyrhizobium sp.]